MKKVNLSTKMQHLQRYVYYTLQQTWLSLHYWRWCQYPSRRELYKATARYRCQFVITGKPTYWPTAPFTTPYLIFLILVKNVPSNYIKIQDGVDMNSDHFTWPFELNTGQDVVFIKPILGLSDGFRQQKIMFD